MYSFYDETVLRLGLPLENTSLSRIVFFYKEGVVVEGHSGLLDCKAEEIVFRIKKEKVRIVGEELRLERVTPDQLFIRGKIKSVGTVENG